MGHDDTHLRILTARVRPSFASNRPRKERAQGMPGARCTRSLACKNKIAHEVVTTGSPEQPGIPRAMVLTVSFVISPVIGLFCHRHRQVTTCQLDASVEASGPHDFAVRISTFRQACFNVHRIPCPTSVTIAKRPSAGRDGVLIVLIWVNREQVYFSNRGWTGNH